MFQLIDSSTSYKIDDSIAFFEGQYIAVYDNGSFHNEVLFIEKCEFEKNINKRYIDILKKKLNFGRPVEEFFCISPKNGNLSLFYKPNIGYSFISLNIFIKNISIYTPDNIESIIVSENNIINHNNKDKPISENFIYHMTSSFHSIEFTSINYDIQFIKYESDDSFFLNNYKNYSGITFNSMSSKRKTLKGYNLTNNIEYNKCSVIGEIIFGINKANFDNYKRSYKKLQALLAEIMSVLSIIFEVARQILYFLNHKTISKEIIRYIFYEDNNHISTEQNHNINLLKVKGDNKIILNKNEIKIELMNKTNNNEYHENKFKYKNNNTSKEEIFPKKEKNNNLNLNGKIIKEINYYHILKSYFCFKDKRAKLINLCHNIISEDMSIEHLLKKLNQFENIYNYYYKKEKENFEHIKNKRFKEINKYIDKINNEIESKNIKNGK